MFMDLFWFMEHQNKKNLSYLRYKILYIYFGSINI